MRHNYFVLSFVLFILVIINLSFKQHKSFKNNYTLTIEKEKFYKKGEHYFLKVPVIFKNNTDTTLNYWSMTCSWYNIYILKSESLKWDTDSLQCTGNIPVLLKLYPHESSEVELRFELPNEYKYPIKYKVGIMIINNKGKNGYKYVFNKDYIYTTIWSEKKIWNN